MDDFWVSLTVLLEHGLTAGPACPMIVFVPNSMEKTGSMLLRTCSMSVPISSLMNSRKEILRSMIDMGIRKRGHHVVAVIVIRLVTDLDPLDTSFFSGIFKVLGKQLSLFVEAVPSALLKPR
jgi:hypothetical protein